MHPEMDWPFRHLGNVQRVAQMSNIHFVLMNMGRPDRFTDAPTGFKTQSTCPTCLGMREFQG
jgi:hypothetical protein